jgi:hypothetical protein
MKQLYAFSKEQDMKMASISGVKRGDRKEWNLAELTVETNAAYMAKGFENNALNNKVAHFRGKRSQVISSTDLSLTTSSAMLIARENYFWKESDHASLHLAVAPEEKLSQSSPILFLNKNQVQSVGNPSIKDAVIKIRKDGWPIGIQTGDPCFVLKENTLTMVPYWSTGAIYGNRVFDEETRRHKLGTTIKVKFKKFVNHQRTDSLREAISFAEQANMVTLTIEGNAAELKLANEQNVTINNMLRVTSRSNDQHEVYVSNGVMDLRSLGVAECDPAIPRMVGLKKTRIFFLSDSLKVSDGVKERLMEGKKSKVLLVKRMSKASQSELLLKNSTGVTLNGGQEQKVGLSDTQIFNFLSEASNRWDRRHIGSTLQIHMPF